MESLPRVLILGAWLALWIAGGCLLAAAFFRLRRGEWALVGVGLGLALEIWLANVLAHFLPAPTSFWLSSFLVFSAGVITAAVFRHQLRLEASLMPWIILVSLTLLFHAIGRGLAIFDDYQNLPTLSLMAAGDIPPHFALNPSLSFGYHYFLLLLSAQIMRLGGMSSWTALDLGRAIVLALPLTLAGLWGYRMTRSRVAAILTGLMLAFAGGTRWLLLLWPPTWLDAVSNNVTLIGSAASSAPTLADAMLSTWKIDGAGPIAFPFAFYTGMNQPYIMAYTGIAGSGILILLVLLLTARRWRHWSAGILTAFMIASLAIANEIAFLLIGLGMILSAGAWIIARHTSRPPRDLLLWIEVLIAAAVIAGVQGGMLSDIVSAGIAGRSLASNYFDARPVLLWPPAMVSAHLGLLSITDPLQLAAGLAEIGPVILVTPLLVAWGLKSVRVGNWLQASVIGASCGAVIAPFVTFKGPLFTATPRLMGGWFFACILYAAPLLWIWAARRGDRWKVAGLALGSSACLGGIVLFGIQMIAVQKPVYATFITPMDAKISQEYWNKLPPGAWIFDPVVFRAPTVFGRFTNSSPTWYTRAPEWQDLDNNPDPFRLRAAGFGYIYFDSDYWNALSPMQRTLLGTACVRQIAQVDGIHGEKDYTKDFRRLLDIQACR